MIDSVVSTDLDPARVPPDGQPIHPTLFPLANYGAPARAPADLCRSMGLNWMAAARLHKRGWLSFNPKTTPMLSPAQEAELRFLGALVVAGCDEALIGQMLGGLREPYAYRIELMYYDWEEQTWRLRPSDSEHRERLSHWVDEMEEAAELEKLEDLRTRVDTAIREVRSWAPW